MFYQGTEREVLQVKSANKSSLTAGIRDGCSLIAQGDYRASTGRRQGVEEVLLLYIIIVIIIIIIIIIGKDTISFMQGI
jgi:hypothetical protein